MLLVARADRAVRAVGGHHQLAVINSDTSSHCASELDPDADSEAVVVQRLQEIDSRHPVEGVVREPDTLSSVHDRHLVEDELLTRDRAVHLGSDVSDE